MSTCATEKSSETQVSRNTRVYRPNVDFMEGPAEYRLLADLPGVRAEDVDIQCDSGTLTIRAKPLPRHQPDSARLLRGEYGVGDFERTFRIGEGVDVAGIQAELANGVLTLRLPKVESAKPRKIEVRG